MWIILGLLFSASVFALESFERLQNVKIIRVLDRNIVMVNRGLEDGIMVNDHAKFMQEEGYSARAICIKTKGDLSYWKLYRIANAETISKDIPYTIVGMADREIPFPQADMRSEGVSFKDPEDFKKKKTAETDPFAVKRDLPEKLTERDLIETVGPDKRKLFIEKALNQDQMRRDLQDFRVSVYASPFTRQSINEGESRRYGIRGGNMASKYRLMGQFEQQQSKMTDPLTKEEVSTRSTMGQAQFVIHRLNAGMSSLSILNYNSQRFSELGTPKSQWQFGPIGFTWHMFENKTWEYFDLSYVPLYDIRTTDVIQDDGRRNEEKTNGLRHGFRLGVKTRINERVAFENLLWVKPFQDLASWKIESDNLNLSNDLKLIFNISGNLFLDYNFVYQYDILWKELSDLPSTNTINSLNLRYDFDV